MRVKAGDPQIHSAITRFEGPTENTWKFASLAPKNRRGGVCFQPNCQKMPRVGVRWDELEFQAKEKHPGRGQIQVLDVDGPKPIWKVIQLNNIHIYIYILLILDYSLSLSFFFWGVCIYDVMWRVWVSNVFAAHVGRLGCCCRWCWFWRWCWRS